MQSLLNTGNISPHSAALLAIEWNREDNKAVEDELVGAHAEIPKSNSGLRPF